jgi:hypothetical protein
MSFGSAEAAEADALALVFLRDRVPVRGDGCWPAALAAASAAALAFFFARALDFALGIDDEHQALITSKQTRFKFVAPLDCTQQQRFYRPYLAAQAPSFFPCQ